jgi:hypothetical protein
MSKVAIEVITSVLRRRSQTSSPSTWVALFFGSEARSARLNHLNGRHFKRVPRLPARCMQLCAPLRICKRSVFR